MDERLRFHVVKIVDAFDALETPRESMCHSVLYVVQIRLTVENCNRANNEYPDLRCFNLDVLIRITILGSNI